MGLMLSTVLLSGAVEPWGHHDPTRSSGKQGVQLDPRHARQALHLSLSVTLLFACLRSMPTGCSAAVSEAQESLVVLGDTAGEWTLAAHFPSMCSRHGASFPAPVLLIVGLYGQKEGDQITFLQSQ